MNVSDFQTGFCTKQAMLANIWRPRFEAMKLNFEQYDIMTDNLVLRYLQWLWEVTRDCTGCWSKGTLFAIWPEIKVCCNMRLTRYKEQETYCWGQRNSTISCMESPTKVAPFIPVCYYTAELVMRSRERARSTLRVRWWTYNGQWNTWSPRENNIREYEHHVILLLKQYVCEGKWLFLQNAG